MKSASLLFSALIIIILLISESVVIVHAQTLTKDFGEINFNSSDYSGHNIFATMDVKATIETEPNGHWILNNTYQVNLLISITYVNESVYNAHGFSIECYNPDNPVYDAIMNPSKYNIDVMVTPQNSGTMSMILRPQSAGNTTLNGLDFALKIYYNSNIVTSGSWVWYMNSNNDNTNQPLSVMVDSNQHLPFDTTTPTPTIPEFPTLIILPLFAVATLLSIVLIRTTLSKKKL